MGWLTKEAFFCSKCNIAVHKKCEKSKISDGIFLCKFCRPVDTDLEELPFHELSFLEDINNQINITPIEDTSENENIWNFFEKKGLHFIHFNINSLLDKIDQLRSIADKHKPSIIGITDSKIDNTVTDTEIDIQGYTPIRNDRTRHGGGVVVYIKEGIGFNRRDNFSSEF